MYINNVQYSTQSVNFMKPETSNVLTWCCWISAVTEFLGITRCTHIIGNQKCGSLSRIVLNAVLIIMSVISAAIWIQQCSGHPALVALSSFMASQPEVPTIEIPDTQHGPYQPDNQLGLEESQVMEHSTGCCCWPWVSNPGWGEHWQQSGWWC